MSYFSPLTGPFLPARSKLSKEFSPPKKDSDRQKFILCWSEWPPGHKYFCWTLHYTLHVYRPWSDLFNCNLSLWHWPWIFMPPDCMIGGILFLSCLSVCLFVCLLSTLTFAITWTVRGRYFIFGMHTPLMMPFQMTPRSMTLWPWLWPLL